MLGFVAALVVTGDDLVLRLTTAEHIEGFHRDIVVPMSSVASVWVSEDMWSDLRGLRAPGTGLPGIVAVGTRRGSFGKDFTVIHGKGRGVIVDLEDQEFSRLMVTVAQPEEVLAQLTSHPALRHRDLPPSHREPT